MSTIKINFANVIPQGCYDVIIKDVKLKTSKSSSNQYLNWKLEITDGDFAGKYIFLSTSLSISSQWYLKRFLCAINYPCEDETVELNLDKTKERPLWVRLIPDSFNGKQSYQIMDFGPPDSLCQQIDDDNDQQTFSIKE